MAEARLPDKSAARTFAQAGEHLGRACLGWRRAGGELANVLGVLPPQSARGVQDQGSQPHRARQAHRADDRLCHLLHVRIIMIRTLWGG
jgi:hypothetical protein